VEEVVDLPLVLGDPAAVDPESSLGEVALDDVHASLVAPLQGEPLEPAPRRGADQDEHVALTVVEELLDEVATDEASGAGDEVGHPRVTRRRGRSRT
jgi:hypothetical protein